MSAAVGVHAFLADAVTRADGKLYAHGAGWNVLGVARLPAVHGHLGQEKMGAEIAQRRAVRWPCLGGRAFG